MSQLLAHPFVYLISFFLVFFFFASYRVFATLFVNYVLPTYPTFSTVTAANQHIPTKWSSTSVIALAN